MGVIVTLTRLKLMPISINVILKSFVARGITPKIKDEDYYINTYKYFVMGEWLEIDDWRLEIGDWRLRIND